MDWRDWGEAEGGPEVVRGALPGDRYVRRQQYRPRGLRRTLRVAALFSSGYLNVGSSIYYALGIIALFALGAAPLALAVAGFFFVLTALTYIEVSVAIPEAEGSPSFARRGFNELAGFAAGWVTLLSYTMTIAISAFVAIGYLGVFFPALKSDAHHVIFSLALIGVLMGLNALGVHEAAFVAIVLAGLDLLVKVLFVVVGGIFLLNLPLLVDQIHWGTAPSASGFILAISLGMVAYTGIGTITNMAHEAKDSSSMVPRAYGLLIGAVIVLFIAISVVGLSAMPVYQATGDLPEFGVQAGQWTSDLSTRYIDDPVSGVAQQLPSPYGSIVGPMVGVLAFIALTMAANAGLQGVARRSHRMAIYQQVPGVFSRVSARFRTPYVPILLFGVLAAAMVLPGRLTFLADIYVFGATLTFTFAHASLIALRWRNPELARSFRVPLELTVRGKSIPILAVLGGLGTLAVWGVIVVSRSNGRWIGLGWLALGLLIYVAYRRLRGLPLTQTIRRPPRGR